MSAFVSVLCVRTWVIVCLSSFVCACIAEVLVGERSAEGGGCARVCVISGSFFCLFVWCFLFVLFFIFSGDATIAVLDDCTILLLSPLKGSAGDAACYSGLP